MRDTHPAGPASVPRPDVTAAREWETALVRELETLATLTRSQIAAVLHDPLARTAVVEECWDEYLELRAESERVVDDDEHARHCAQEASAWRATARAVRRLDASARGQGSRRTA